MLPAITGAALCSMLPDTTGAALCSMLSATLSKVMVRHLWYLKAVMIALALSDSAGSRQMKREIVKSMRDTRI